MDRAEHLAWCKKRALEYVDAGDLNQAFTSMASDVMKHEETKMHEKTNTLGMQLLITGSLSSTADMRRWINGYN